VRALQQFETALETGSNDAVAKTLPAVWNAMNAVQLEVPFASLFAERLASLSPQDQIDQGTKTLIWQISLLGPDYETPAQNPPDDTNLTLYLTALALGRPSDTKAAGATAQAITEGFTSKPTLSQQRLLDAGQLGEAILRAIILMDSGARGNPGDLTSALATLRAVGMEDTARRAGLQLMLLERR
jgi:hypothetical protein